MESRTGRDRAAAAAGPMSRPGGGAAASRTDRTGHDLLVAMAGRLPDPLLWRFRDWLAAGAHTALRSSIPRSLLRHRVGVTDAERAMLREVVTAWGGSLRHVDAVLHADTTPEAGATFGAHAAVEGWDAVDVLLRAVLPAVPDVLEVRRTWRSDRAARRAVPPPPARVVLLAARGDLPALAATVARTLRAQGEATPRVEVVGPGTPITAYHRDALAASELLWRGGLPAEPPGAPGPRVGDAPTTAELVGHG